MTMMTLAQSSDCAHDLGGSSSAWIYNDLDSANTAVLIITPVFDLGHAGATTRNNKQPASSPSCVRQLRPVPRATGASTRRRGINLAFFSLRRGAPRWRYDAPRLFCINSHLIIDTILLFAGSAFQLPTLVRGLPIYVISDDTHVWRKHVFTPNRASAVRNSLRAPVTQAVISWISTFYT
jgi:hypothetical protein